MMRIVAILGLALLIPACSDGNGSNKTGTQVAQTVDPAIETFPSEGQEHVDVGTVLVYLTDPPTSGPHYPSPQDGGYFETAIHPGYLVHSLEHGAVVIYYNPATVTSPQKDSLKALAAAHPGTYSQVVCVPRDDAAYPIILTAWTHRLRLPAYDQARIDAFVALYLGQGPESGP
jgi:hypothetical protein